MYERRREEIIVSLLRILCDVDGLLYNDVG